MLGISSMRWCICNFRSKRSENQDCSAPLNNYALQDKQYEETSSSTTESEFTIEANNSKNNTKCDTNNSGNHPLWQIAILAAMSMLAGFSYLWCRTAQGSVVETAFERYAGKIANWAKKDALNVLADLQLMSIHITSSALAEGATWPFYTWHHEFERHCHFLLDESPIELIAFAPIVDEQHKSFWELYARKNEDWIYDKSGIGHEQVARTSYEIPENIFRYINGQRVSEYTTGPHLPLWQYSNADSDKTHVNFNLLSYPPFARAFNVASENRQAVISEAFNVVDAFGQHAINGKDGRESVIVQPIFSNFSSNGRVVGVVIAVISWTVLFKIGTHSTAKGIVCVFRSSCGQAFTYEIDGPTAYYIGEGDLHDEKYDFFEYVSNFGPVMDRNDFQNTHDRKSPCHHRLHLYPTDKFYKAYAPDNINILGLALALTLFVGCIVLMFHNAVMQLVARKLEKNAAKSQALVSSLFPENIREKLLQDPDHIDDKKGLPVLASQAAKMSLDDLMAIENGRREQMVTSQECRIHDKDKPIASLFPQTTVMFADICGFTAWSSQREPEKVFQLLETLYAAFDNIARQRGVFKVETIGDCYIAVAGLPEPQANHAIIMARFSRDCLMKMAQIVNELERIFGPDTGDLGVRFGLHSGPVTAGVLRGQRARFQLYGDTVNLASHMESTGVKNRIQVSFDTAQLLTAAGRSSWLRKREDVVSPLRETFWLLPKQRSSTHSRSTSSSALVGNKSEDENVQCKEISAEGSQRLTEKGRLSTATKLERLLCWHVEVLAKYLKRIVANRKALGKPYANKATMAQCERDILGESSVVDEVSEVIKFSEFSEIVSKKSIDPATVELKLPVVPQLREYVRLISTKYRSNAFHNFEHASHVVMSVEKLLSRMLAYDEENNQTLHDCTYGIASDPVAQFTAIFCALIHDVDHKGVPNSQLVKEKDQLAISHRNRSVQEQNSLEIAWNLLMLDQFVDLRRCIYSNKNELHRFRNLLVNSVIATDLFDKNLSITRETKWAKAFTTSVPSSSHLEPRDDYAHGNSLTIHLRATVVIEYMAQASDVSHTMQHWHVFQTWNEKLFEEMDNAYQEGRSNEDPAVYWYENELSFFDNYIIPLARKLSHSEIFGISSDEYLQYAIANREEWRKKGRQGVASMVEKSRKLLQMNV